MFTFVLAFIRQVFRSIYLVFHDLIYGAKCLSKGCGCDYYSDWQTFDALQRQSHDIFYAQRMVESGIIGTPLKCDKCSCLRECHENLEARNLEPQYMPNGGAIAIEKAKKDKADRINRRFGKTAKKELLVSREDGEKLVWEDLHLPKDDDENNNKTVELDSHITVQYFASFKSDDKEFEKNDKFNFKVGKGDAMRGFDAGVRGMKVNGIRKIEIPPHLAYGANHPVDGRLGETLVFTVKVLACA